MDAKRLSGLLRGRTVAHLEANLEHIAVHFTDESSLVIERTSHGVSVVLHEISPPTALRSKDDPTVRQHEYLDYIRRYMARYGVAPAEADIQDHFMVSAPSVNAMIKTLERRGFITRDRDLFGNTVPRSIRVVLDQF